MRRAGLIPKVREYTKNLDDDVGTKAISAGLLGYRLLTKRRRKQSKESHS